MSLPFDKLRVSGNELPYCIANYFTFFCFIGLPQQIISW